LRIAVALAFVLLSAAACGGDEAEPVADVGDIRCSSTTLSVETPRVTARPDGVHVQVSVSQERGVSASIDEQRVRGPVVLQLAPGVHRVRCSHGDGGSMESSFEVVTAEDAVSK
jgi:hypothetical protein